MRPYLPLLLSALLVACGDGDYLLPPDAILPDGSTYRGDLVEGRLHGRGRIDYPDGSWYEGEFRHGLRHGQGVYFEPPGDRYEGAFENGLFHGTGQLDFTGGGRYVGDFVQGKMQGRGTFDDTDTHYAGAFENGQYNGPGVLEQYDERYVGSFVNGSLVGAGEFTGSDGDHYQGSFAEGLFHGQGRYQSASGEVWTGQFERGTPVGEGVYENAEGARYRGEFRYWHRDGQGRLENPDGSVLEGNFKRGQLDGPGLRTNADGSQEDGFWRNGQRVKDAAGRPIAMSVELALLNQSALLEQSLAAVPPSTPAPELYSLTLAGDGNQSVFLREADYVSQLLRERFAARGQISLVNHRDHLADRPMATRESLARAIRTLAERVGPEDTVLLYLTSHGSAEHELVLRQPGLRLTDLPASELAWLLKPLEQQDKIVIVSACYSGGFIEPLKSERTLVITAARADRSSFGCSETADFTYFGEALFAQALQQTRDLKQAFDMAASRVSEREKADDFEPSEPQIWAPEGVSKRWQQLQLAAQSACESPGGKPCR